MSGEERPYEKIRRGRQKRLEPIRAAANEVAQSHAGRPPAEVRAALEAACRRRGTRWKPGADDQLVAAIVSGDVSHFSQR